MRDIAERSHELELIIKELNMFTLFHRLTCPNTLAGFNSCVHPLCNYYEARCTHPEHPRHAVASARVKERV